jgi:hypothetical protein
MRGQLPIREELDYTLDLVREELDYTLDLVKGQRFAVKPQMFCSVPGDARMRLKC